LIIERIVSWHGWAEATPTPSPEPGIDSSDIRNFLITKIGPILLAAVGVVIVSRAGKGEMSRVLTSSGIVIMGIGFLVGGIALLAFGNHLVDLIFGPAPAP
jgi:hypothetical protein